MRTVRSGMIARHVIALIATASLAAPAWADEPLAVVGFHRVLEMGPMLAAAEAMPPGSVTIGNGSIPSLWPGVVDKVAPNATTQAGNVPDLAGNAETQLLRQSVQHPDLRVILTVTEGMYRLVARKSSGIRTLPDLRGKRIATVAATSSAYYLDSMLARAGLTEGDVTIVTGKAEEISAMLIDGRADALAVYEPEPERARQALGGDAVELSEFGVYRELYNLNATAATLADPVKRRQTVAFVRALLTACHDATYDPDHVQALTAQNSGYDLALVKAAWRHHQFSCKLPTDLLDVLVEEEQWLAAQDKRAPRSRDELARLIDPSILAEAQAD